ELSRFFRLAGYPVPILRGDSGWGAWSQEKLIGAIALCNEGNELMLRGPEVAFEHRRRRVGVELLKRAVAQINARTCYCVAYAFLGRMYAREGFRACPEAERPGFLVRRVANLRQAKWDVIVLRRKPE